MREKHGMSGTPEHRTWLSMLARCRNPNKTEFKRYGGRGISVCKRWAESFLAFMEDMGPRPHGMSIDRIDNNGNYEPGNCRWASTRQQSLNKHNTKVVTYEGKEMPLLEACEKAGIKHNTAIWRLLHGYDWLTGPPPRTHCDRGHEMSGYNAMPTGPKRTRKTCRECQNINYRKRWAANSKAKRMQGNQTP